MKQFVLVGLLELGSALVVSPLAATQRAPVEHRASTLRCMAADTRCAMIELNAEEPLRLAQVLKKSWMEGGIKRGLVGTVLVGEGENQVVKIAAQGPEARLKSFAEWIETSSMLVQSVEILPTEDCPAVPLTNKFPLADAEKYSGKTPGSFAGQLADELKKISVEIKDKRGTTQSNDEGLF